MGRSCIFVLCLQTYTKHGIVSIFNRSHFLSLDTHYLHQGVDCDNLVFCP